MSENEETIIGLYKCIVDTRTDVNRIFKHSDEIKLSLKEVIYKIEQVNKTISQKEIESRERDNVIEFRVNREIKNLYKAVAIFGISSLASMIGGALVFLASQGSSALLKNIISTVAI